MLEAMRAGRSDRAGPGFRCLDCGARFRYDARLFHGLALALGAIGIAVVALGQLLPFFVCVLAAIFLMGPPRCPSCRGRSTVRATRDDDAPRPPRA